MRKKIKAKYLTIGAVVFTIIISIVFYFSKTKIEYYLTVDTDCENTYEEVFNNDKLTLFMYCIKNDRITINGREFSLRDALNKKNITLPELWNDLYKKANTSDKYKYDKSTGDDSEYIWFNKNFFIAKCYDEKVFLNIYIIAYSGKNNDTSSGCDPVKELLKEKN